MRIGTANFVDFASALYYYREYENNYHNALAIVNRKLEAGEIKIGPPKEVFSDEKLEIVAGRYIKVISN